MRRRNRLQFLAPQPRVAGTSDSCEPSGQEGAFGGVVGVIDRPPIPVPGLFDPIGAAEQVGPGRGVLLDPFPIAIAVEGFELGQAVLGSVVQGYGDDPVQPDRAGRDQGEQVVVEADDARPVGVGRAGLRSRARPL